MNSGTEYGRRLNRSEKCPKRALGFRAMWFVDGKLRTVAGSSYPHVGNVGRFGRRETPRHCFRRLHPVRTGSSDPGVLSVGVRMRSGQSPLPLLRRHQREAARRVGWTKEGRRHCGA